MKKFLVCVFLLAAPPAWADAAAPLVVEEGPIVGAPNARREVILNADVLEQTKVFDVQDGREHSVRGLPLRKLLGQLATPKRVDTVVFAYTDGMQIPVKLSDRPEVDALFVAFFHGDVLERFSSTYPVDKKFELTCPKVVYGRKAGRYILWHSPTQLASIRLVTWRAFEAQLAQPTRRVPNKAGWKLYLQHCQACHGIGGQGATRGPDFLSHMDAYRRIPPLAQTNEGEIPSLHEKVTGYVDGTMPVLNHIRDADITKLWNWLHAIHRSGTQ